jgi:hypothetical protein
MLVQGIGMDTIAAVAPFSTSFVIPDDGPVGRINIVVLARDASGDLLGDTLGILVTPVEPLSRLVVDPESIELDDQVIRAKIEVLGTYVRGSDTIMRDLSDGTSGTSYAMLHGESVARVDADGLVQGVAIGNDTVLVTHGDLRAYVPITVSGVPSDVDEPVTGSGSNLVNSGLVVFPNPVTSIAEIQFGAVDPGRAKLEIVDMLGRVVRSDISLLERRGDDVRALDLAGLTAGVYLLRLQTGVRTASTLIRVVR